MTRVMVALLAALGVVAACQPHFCEDTLAHCDGNVAVNACSGGVSTGNEHRDCGALRCTEGFDHDGYRFAACTLDGNPDARCPAIAEGAFCDGDRAVDCAYGFPVASRDCAVDSLLCATDGVQTACVESRDPDVRCLESRLFCRDGVLEACFQQLRTPQTDCKKIGSFCRDNGTEGACVLDDTPDPRCKGENRFCDGTRGFECFDGFRQSLAGDCAPQGKTCVATVDYFGCR